MMQKRKKAPERQVPDKILNLLRVVLGIQIGQMLGLLVASILSIMI